MEKVDEMVKELVGEDSGKMEKEIVGMVEKNVELCGKTTILKVVELGGEVKVVELGKLKVAEVDGMVQLAGMDLNGQENKAKSLVDKHVVVVDIEQNLKSTYLNN